MKKALISLVEITTDYLGNPLGNRVAEVRDVPFEVDGTFLAWVDCSDEIVADQFYWNGLSFVAVPPRPISELPVAQQTNTVTTGNGGPNVVA